MQLLKAQWVQRFRLLFFAWPRYLVNDFFLKIIPIWRRIPNMLAYPPSGNSSTLSSLTCAAPAKTASVFMMPALAQPAGKQSTLPVYFQSTQSLSVPISDCAHPLNNQSWQHRPAAVLGGAETGHWGRAGGRAGRKCAQVEPWHPGALLSGDSIRVHTPA